jgi:5-methylcytosine-specific restriction endonuclease McrA
MRPSTMKRRIKILPLWDEQDGKCFICGRQMRGTMNPSHPLRRTKEHIVPKSRGGDSHPFNISLSHSKCNEKRGNPIPTDAQISEWSRRFSWSILRYEHIINLRNKIISATD